MFQSVLTTVLNATLGKFLKLDNISIGLSGLIDLKNVELNAEYISALLPISLKLGHVGHINISLSWTGLLTTPIVVTVSDVYAVVSLPSDDTSIDLSLMTEKIIQQKLEALLSWELLKFPEKEVEQDKGSLMKTIDVIVDHITVDVQRVHVVFDHPGINCGMIVNKVQVYPIDETGNQLTVCAASAATVARRHIQVDDFGVYLNIDTDTAVYSFYQEQQKREYKNRAVISCVDTIDSDNTKQKSHSDAYNEQRKNKSQRHTLSPPPSSNVITRTIPQPGPLVNTVSPITLAHLKSLWDDLANPHWHWLIPPLSLSVGFNQWKGTIAYLQGLSPQRPMMEATVHMTDVAINLTRQQYEGSLTLLAQTLNNPATIAFIKLQTQTQLAEMIKKSSGSGSGDQHQSLTTLSSAELEDVLTYIQLYKRNFQGYTERSPVETDTMVQFERERPLTTILEWREMAIQVVQREYQLEGSPAWRQKQSGGLFSLFSGKSSTAPQLTLSREDIVTIITTNMNNNLFDYHASDADKQIIDPHYTKIAANVLLDAVSFCLVQHDRTKLLTIGIFDLSASVSLRNNNIVLHSMIDRLEAIDHLAQDPSLSHFISKPKEISQKFLSANVSVGDKFINPSMDYDNCVQCTITGVDVIVNLPMLLEMSQFFLPPPQFVIASQFTNEIYNEFASLSSQLTSSMSSAVSSRIATRGRQCVDIVVQAPTIIIPTDPSNQASHVLVTHLGQLSLKCTPPDVKTAQHHRKVIQESLKDPSVLAQLSRDQRRDFFYDTFDISITNVCAYIGDPRFLHCPVDNVFLIRPMSIDLSASMCIVGQNDLDALTISSSSETLELPPLILQMNMPSIDLTLSTLKIGRLLRLTKALLSQLKSFNDALIKKERAKLHVNMGNNTLVNDDSPFINDDHGFEAIVDHGDEVFHILDDVPIMTDSSTSVSSSMRPTNMVLIGLHMGQISLTIEHDLISPLPVMSVSCVGLSLAIAVRNCDVDVSMVLQTFMVQQHLQKFNKNMVLGTPRPLITFNTNHDASFMLKKMLSLPNSQSMTDSKRAAATMIDQASDDLFAPQDSGFLSAHIFLPLGTTSPLYAFINTLCTVHFGQVAIAINRETLPPLAYFFTAQLLPTPHLTTIEDIQFGKATLDFFTQEESFVDDGIESHQTSQSYDNDMEAVTDVSTPIGFDPSILHSGLSQLTSPLAAIASNANNNSSSGNNHSHHNIHTIIDLINSPPLTLHTLNPDANTYQVQNDLSLIHSTASDEAKNAIIIQKYFDDLLFVDQVEFDQQYFGLLPNTTPAYPNLIPQSDDGWIQLSRLNTTDFSAATTTQRLDALRDRKRLRAQIIRTKITQYATIASKLQHFRQLVRNLRLTTSYDAVTPHSPLPLSSSELLELHRYLNAKLLLLVSRLKQRQVRLDESGGSYFMEKIELRNRLDYYEGTLIRRRAQLIYVRQYERVLNERRQLGRLFPLYHKTHITSRGNNQNNKNLNKDTPKIAVLALPRSCTGPALSLLQYISQQQPDFRITYDLLYDEESADVVEPIVPTSIITPTNLNDSHHITIMAVIARMTFGGITIDLCSGGDTLLRTALTGFKMGFGMSDFGISAKMIMKSFQVLDTSSNPSHPHDIKLTPSQDYIDMAISLQLARQRTTVLSEQDLAVHLTKISDHITTEFKPESGSALNKYQSRVKALRFVLNYPSMVFTSNKSNSCSQAVNTSTSASFSDDQSMIDICVFMRSPELVVFDDTDSDDYFSTSVLYRLNNVHFDYPRQAILMPHDTSEHDLTLSPSLTIESSNFPLKVNVPAFATSHANTVTIIPNIAAEVYVSGIRVSFTYKTVDLLLKYIDGLPEAINPPQSQHIQGNGQHSIQITTDGSSRGYPVSQSVESTLKHAQSTALSLFEDSVSYLEDYSHDHHTNYRLDHSLEFHPNGGGEIKNELSSKRINNLHNSTQPATPAPFLFLVDLIVSISDVALIIPASSISMELISLSMDQLLITSEANIISNMTAFDKNLLMLAQQYVSHAPDSARTIMSLPNTTTLSKCTTAHDHGFQLLQPIDNSTLPIILVDPLVSCEKKNTTNVINHCDVDDDDDDDDFFEAEDFDSCEESPEDAQQQNCRGDDDNSSTPTKSLLDHINNYRTYQYHPVSITFKLALSGVSVSTLLIASHNGLRDPSPMPAIKDVWTAEKPTSLKNSARLHMIDMMKVGSVEMKVQNSEYIPLVFIDHKQPKTTPSRLAMNVTFRTQHIFNNNIEIVFPDWLTTIGLDNVDIAISQPQLSLLLCLMVTANGYSGNLNERASGFVFPVYLPRIPNPNQLIAANRLTSPASFWYGHLSAAEWHRVKVTHAGLRAHLLRQHNSQIRHGHFISMSEEWEEHGKNDRHYARTTALDTTSRLTRQTALKPHQPLHSQQQLPDRTAPSKAHGLGLLVDLNIGRCTVQVATDPLSQNSSSIAVVTVFKTRAHMYPCGSISVLASSDNTTIVNAILPTNPAFLQQEIANLSANSAIIKPFSFVSTIFISPTVHDYSASIAPLPTLYSHKMNQSLESGRDEVTRRKVADQKITVKAMVSPIDIKISYSDYEIISLILGSLVFPSSPPSPTTTATTISPATPTATPLVHSNPIDNKSTHYDGEHASLEPVVQQTTVLSLLTHTMGEMSAVFNLANCNITFVNDSNGLSLPFLSVQTRNVAVNTTAFAHRRDIHLSLTSSLSFHNSATVSTEPLVEESAFAIDITQSITHPLKITLTSPGAVNLNVTRAMMESLSQTLQLFSHAQQAQQERIDEQMSLFVTSDGTNNNTNNNDDSNNSVNPNDSLSTKSLFGSHIRDMLDPIMVQDTLSAHHLISKKDFSFFKLTNDTQYPLYYAFGPHVADAPLQFTSKHDIASSNNEDGSFIDVDQLYEIALDNVINHTDVTIHDHFTALSDYARKVVLQIRNIEYGGFFPHSENGMAHKMSYDSQKQQYHLNFKGKAADNGQNRPNLTKSQRKRLFRFQILYTYWHSREYFSLEQHSSSSSFYGFLSPHTDQPISFDKPNNALNSLVTIENLVQNAKTETEAVLEPSIRAVSTFMKNIQIGHTNSRKFKTLANKLVSLQLTGYHPIHNISIDSLSCRSYSLYPISPHSSPMNVLIDINITHGIKTLSVRSSRAFVNLVDLPLELKHGVNLEHSQIVMPGETFNFPLIPQTTLGGGYSIAIRPITTNAHSFANLSTTIGRSSLNMAHFIDINEAFSHFKYSFPVELDSLTNASVIKLQPLDTFPYVVEWGAIIHRFRKNGLTMFCLCPPVSVTNLLSERAVITLSTKQRQYKKSVQVSIDDASGYDIICDVAPTHSVHCYSSPITRTSHRPEKERGQKVASSPQYTFPVSRPNDLNAPLYVSITIPNLDLVSVVDLPLSDISVDEKQKMFTLHLARKSDLVHGIKKPRSLVVHVEASFNSFLLQQKTTDILSCPQTHNAPHLIQQMWSKLSKSTVISAIMQTPYNELVPISTPSALPTINAGLKLTLFVPYWIFDNTDLGVVVSNQQKIRYNADVSPTQYDLLSVNHHAKQFSPHFILDKLLAQDFTKYGYSTSLITDTHPPTLHHLTPPEETVDDLCYVKATMYSTDDISSDQPHHAHLVLTKPYTSSEPISNKYINAISETSGPFSLDGVGIEQIIEVCGVEQHLSLQKKKDKKIYVIAVLVRSGTGIFRRTKQIYFSPRFVMVNKTMLPMVIRQHSFDDIAQLKDQSSTAISQIRRNLNPNNNYHTDLTEFDYEGNIITPQSNADLLSPELALESRHHVKACFVDRTELFLPCEQPEPFHWSYSHEKKLISFKLLTKDDPFSPNITTTHRKFARDRIAASLNILPHEAHITPAEITDSILDGLNAPRRFIPQQCDSAFVISAIPDSQNPTRSLAVTSPWDDGVYNWSGYIDLSQMGDQSIIIRNPVTNKSFMIKVKVVSGHAPDTRATNSGNSVLVIFEPADISFPKYRIENKTAQNMVRVSQRGCQDFLTLGPYSETIYTFDQPLIEPHIQLDIVSGTRIVQHLVDNINQVGPKATIIIPEDYYHADHNDTNPNNQANNRGGLLITGSRRNHQHNVYVYVLKEGPTRVLVISDFPAVNTTVDLLTSKLLSTPESIKNVEQLYEQYALGRTGVDVGNVIEQLGLRALTSSHSPQQPQQILIKGVGFSDSPASSLTSADPQLLAMALANRSISCDYLTVAHPVPFSENTQRQSALMNQFYPPTVSRLAKLRHLSQFFPGFNIWDQFHHVTAQNQAAKAIGADKLTLSAAEILELVKVRAQTISTILSVYQQVEHQEAVLRAFINHCQIQTINNKDNHSSQLNHPDMALSQPELLTAHEQHLIAPFTQTADVAYLLLDVKEARWLTSASVSGTTSDCYASITFNNQKFRTPVVKSLNPLFDTEMLFRIDGPLLMSIREAFLQFREQYGDHINQDSIGKDDNSYNNHFSLLELPETALNALSLKISIFHHNTLLSDTFLGGVVISNLDSILVKQWVADSVDGSAEAPIMTDQWFKLHAIRQNKLSHGGVRIGIGFFPNELAKQRYILHTLKRDLYKQIDLLTKLTSKFARELRLMDVGVVDINTLQLYPQLIIPKTNTFMNKYDIQTKEQKRSGSIDVSVGSAYTMTQLGPICVPAVGGFSHDFMFDELPLPPNVYKCENCHKTLEVVSMLYCENNCCFTVCQSCAANSSSVMPPRCHKCFINVSKWYKENRAQHFKNAPPAPRVTLLDDNQIDSILSQLAQLVILKSQRIAKSQEELTVSVDINGIDINKSHVLDILAHTNKIFPEWCPVKLTGVVVCNGHVSKIDLFEFVYPQSPPNTNNTENNLPIIAQEKPHISLSSLIGPAVGDLSVSLPELNELDNDEDINNDDSRISASNITSSQSNLSAHSSSDLQSNLSAISSALNSKNTNSRDIYVSLVQTPGRSHNLTFTIPAAIIRSYSDSVNSGVAPPMDAPAVQITVMCEVERRAARSLSDYFNMPPPETDSIPISLITIPLIDCPFIDPLLDPETAPTYTKFDETSGERVTVDSLGRVPSKLSQEDNFYFVDTSPPAQSSPRHNTQQCPSSVIFGSITTRMAKPITPLINLTPKEVSAANNFYSILSNQHAFAAYLYQCHLDASIANYRNIEYREAEVLFIAKEQARLRQIAADKKTGKKSDDDEILEQTNLLMSPFPGKPLNISLTVPADQIILGIDAECYPTLRPVPLSHTRLSARVNLSPAYPLVERAQMHVVLSCSRFGMSLVDSLGGPQVELLYISSRDLVIDFQESLSQRAIELKVGGFQIDQCIDFNSSTSRDQSVTPDVDKIIFGPSYQALQSDHPFVHVSINQTKTPATYPIQVFEYASILIQEMDVRIEEVLIWHLLRFGNDILLPLIRSNDEDFTQQTCQIIDTRIFYKPTAPAFAAAFSFNVLHIQPISVFFTFRATPDMRSPSDDLEFTPIQAVLGAITGVVGSIDAAPLCFNSLLIKDAAGDVLTLVTPIVSYYVAQGIRESYKIVASVEIIGNPFSVVNGISNGCKEMFYEPQQGQVVSGILKGSSSIALSLSTGILDGVAGITKSLSTGLSTMTMDSEYQRRRRQAHSQKITHVGDGLVAGQRAFTRSLFSAVSGVIYDPLNGFRKRGIKGAAAGLGKGVTGLVTKTTTGVVDMVSLSVKGLSNTFKLLGQDKVMALARIPRYISPYGHLTTYDETFALGRLLTKITPYPSTSGAVSEVFATLTGVDSHSRSNLQLEDEHTMDAIRHKLNNKTFYDVDVNLNNMTNNLSSVLAELESLIQSSNIHRLSDNSSRIADAPSKAQMDKLKDIYNAIKNRLNFIHKLKTEDIVSTFVINNHGSNGDNTPKNNSHRPSPPAHLSQRLADNATIIVISTHRIIAADVRKIVKVSHDGGSINSRDIRLNQFLSDLVDISIHLPDPSPNIQEMNDPRYSSQYKMKTTIISESNKKLINQALSATNTPPKLHALINFSYNQQANSALKTKRLIVYDRLEATSLYLELTSLLTNCKVVSCEVNGQDITNNFDQQLSKKPITPASLCASSNSSKQLYLELIGTNSERSAARLPDDSTIQAVCKLYKVTYKPTKVYSVEPLIHASDTICTLTRTFNPLQHGLLPQPPSSGVYLYPTTTLVKSPVVVGLKRPQTLSGSEFFNIITTDNEAQILSNDKSQQFRPKIVTLTYFANGSIKTVEFLEHDDAVIII